MKNGGKFTISLLFFRLGCFGFMILSLEFNFTVLVITFCCRFSFIVLTLSFRLCRLRDYDFKFAVFLLCYAVLFVLLFLLRRFKFTVSVLSFLLYRAVLSYVYAFKKQKHRYKIGVFDMFRYVLIYFWYIFNRFDDLFQFSPRLFGFFFYRDPNFALVIGV